MRCYFILLTLFLLAWTHAEELYSDKYDYLNVDEILENDRLREQYYACFMDSGPCITPEAIFFKNYLSEVFSTNCKKCTSVQKQNFDKIADWYNKNMPDKWNTLVEKVLNDIKKTSK